MMTKGISRRGFGWPLEPIVKKTTLRHNYDDIPIHNFLFLLINLLSKHGQVYTSI